MTVIFFCFWNLGTFIVFIIDNYTQLIAILCRHRYRAAYYANSMLPLFIVTTSKSVALNQYQ